VLEKLQRLCLLHPLAVDVPKALHSYFFYHPAVSDHYSLHYIITPFASGNHEAQFVLQV
jgi:hypothetical protein